MDKYAARRTTLVMNGVDISGYVSDTTISHSKEKIDVTGYGDAREYLPGIPVTTFRLSGWYQGGSEAYVKAAIEASLEDGTKQMVSFFMEPEAGMAGKLYNFFGENVENTSPVESAIAMNMAAQVVDSPIKVKSLCDYTDVVTTVVHDTVEIDELSDEIKITYAVMYGGTDCVVVEASDDELTWDVIATITDGFGTETITNIGYGFVRCTLVGTGLAPVKAIVAIHV